MPSVLSSDEVPGPQGPSGPAGAAGPAGPAGSPGANGTGDATYLHLEAVPSDTWTIDHMLGKEPTVTVIDSAGTEVQGDVAYPSLDRVILTFAAAFSGRARLN